MPSILTTAGVKRRKKRMAAAKWRCWKEAANHGITISLHVLVVWREELWTGWEECWAMSSQQ